eukprot:c23911_g1_i1 orf=77-2851(+)
MLVTCEDGSNAIRVLDKYPFVNFMHLLKGIQARDLTNIGASMQHIFGFLHLQHLVTDIDRFGQGRNPCSIDPTIIMLLTDGTELTSLSGVLPSALQSLLPQLSVRIGEDMVTQSLRWDQRVFAIVLRIPSVSQAMLEKMGPLPQNAPISGSHTAVSMDNAISALCESTGGKCFVATSWRVLLQHVELVASRLTPSVIVSFEHMPVPGSADLPPQVLAACQRKVMLVRGGQMQGHWPIPESYLPDPSHPEIQPREPHPVIVYKAVDSDSYIPSNFICDKYEVENNPFMGLPHKGFGGACWQVFVHGSKGPTHGIGDPFGFLRLNHGGLLTLLVLPYNYPVLWQLLKQVVRNPGSASAKIPATPQWRQDMERYCSSIPVYYGPPLRAALKRWGLHSHIVPEGLENTWLTGFVVAQLKQLKAEAKADLDMEMSHILTDEHLTGGNMTLISSSNHGRVLPINVSATAYTQNADSSLVCKNDTVKDLLGTRMIPSSVRGIGLGDHIGAQKSWDSGLPHGPSTSSRRSPSATSENSGAGNAVCHGYGNGTPCNFSSPQRNSGLRNASVFKNPFDTPKEQLLRQLIQLPIYIASAFDAHRSERTEKGSKQSKSALSCIAACIAAAEEDEARHSLPIEKMGDFNEALLKQQPPRNPFADESDRNKQLRSMFGNPYRQEKNDGADEAWQEGTTRLLSRGRKRRRRSESIGASPSSMSSLGSSSEGSVDTVSANEQTSMTDSPADSLGGSGETMRLGMNVQGSKLNDKGNETMSREGLDSTTTSDDFITGKEKGSEIVQVCVEEKDHRKLEGGIALSHQEENTISVTGIENIEHTSQSGWKKLVYVTPPVGKKDQHEVASFILTAIKILRHTRPGNTEKLFEMLSCPDFPVDKFNFLEQLIEQAHCYNKGNVAKELSEYRNQYMLKSAPAIENV